MVAAEARGSIAARQAAGTLRIVQAEARGLYDVRRMRAAMRRDARGAFVPRTLRTAR